MVPIGGLVKDKISNDFWKEIFTYGTMFISRVN